ncbi:Acyl-CoA synthetase family member 2, mitochondrial [Holothuria leucospilota]|uniref:Medium-chain acyl-CoA ligase ACSF2, mitochondrial n=1 Tax=Holothuria leucospilota TaxID=206669 RepID=A0A9Q0YQ83_HOLLE|nr:Acyl-CoA synthetase family member 2, mitochondrial [Holothuria leucospilota]
MYRAISLTSRFPLVCQTFRDVRAFSSSASVYGLGSDVALKESYCHGASDKPLMGKTIGVALQETVEKFPDKDAFVYRAEGSRYTYRQLLDEVDCLAAGLTATGVRKGDRVGMWGPNSKEWILTQYACARIGAILVNVNPAYRVEETVYALRTVRQKLLH